MEDHQSARRRRTRTLRISPSAWDLAAAAAVLPSTLERISSHSTLPAGCEIEASSDLSAPSEISEQAFA